MVSRTYGLFFLFFISTFFSLYGDHAIVGALLLTSRYSTVKIHDDATFQVDLPIAVWGGTLAREEGGTVTGANITFVDGLLEDAGNQILLNAVYTPSGTITLGGDASFRAEPGNILQAILVSADNNFLSGQPILQLPVTLTDSATTLTIAVQSQMNKDIVLNGGTLVLQNDLAFADNAFITGDGTIHGNNYNIVTGGVPFSWTSNISWFTNITLRTCVNFTGSFTFNAVSNTLQGNGFVYDLTGGGVLTVASGSTLTLSGVVIKGLGNGAGFGKIILADSTSRLVLTNTTLLFSDDFTTSAGVVEVKGPTTAVVKDHDWLFDSSSTFSVDCITVWKDVAGAATCGDILFSPASNLQLFNDGTVDYITLKCTSIIETLDSRVDVLESQIDNVGGDTSAIEALDSRVDLLDSCCEVNDSRIDLLESAVEVNDSRIDLIGEFDSRIDLVESCCEVNDSRIDLLESAVDVNDSRIDLLESAVEVNDSRVDLNESCCEVNDSRIDVLESRVDAISTTDGADSRLDLLESCCEVNDSRIDLLESAVEVNDSRIDLNESCCEVNDSRIDLLEGFDSRIDLVESAVEVNDSRIDLIGEFDSRIDLVESCCEVNDSRIDLLESAVEVNDSRIDVLESRVDAISTTDNADSRLDLLESCCEVNDSRIDVLESEVDNIVVSLPDDLDSRVDLLESCCEVNGSRIEILESLVDNISTETCITRVCSDLNFELSMLPGPGETRVFEFCKCSPCKCSNPEDSAPRVIFDPAVYGGGGRVVLPESSTLMFTGCGTVELKDGVIFELDGTPFGATRADWPQLILDSGAQMVVEASGTATIGGGTVGAGCFITRQGGSVMIDNASSQLIFGETVNNEILVFSEIASHITVDNPTALISFHLGTFDVIFDNNSALQALQGTIEMNTLNGAESAGVIRLFEFHNDSALVIPGVCGQTFGVLRLAPNISNSNVAFDNLTGHVAGNGDIQFVSFSGGAEVVNSVIRAQNNNFDITQPMVNTFMELGYIIERGLVAPSDAAILATQGSRPDQAECGRLVAFCPSRDGSIVGLAQGDHDVFYDRSVSCSTLDLVRGYDRLGRVFTISNCDASTRRPPAPPIT